MKVSNIIPIVSATIVIAENPLSLNLTYYVYVFYTDELQPVSWLSAQIDACLI